MNEKTLATTTDKTPVAMTGRGVQLTTFDEMARFCQAVTQSRLAPKGFDSPQAVMVAVQHGLEIGLSPMQALQSIAVINGRPSLYGDAALALVVSREDCEDVIESFDSKTNTAKCVVKRKDKVEVVRTFTEADARKAGLWGKSGPWTQYPARMLQMRARAFALRDSFPDALKGVGIREEVADYSERPIRGRVIEESAIKFADEENHADGNTVAPAASAESVSQQAAGTSEVEEEERNPDGSFKF